MIYNQLQKICKLFPSLNIENICKFEGSNIDEYYIYNENLDPNYPSIYIDVIDNKYFIIDISYYGKVCVPIEFGYIEDINICILNIIKVYLFIIDRKKEPILTFYSFVNSLRYIKKQKILTDKLINKIVKKKYHIKKKEYGHSFSKLIVHNIEDGTNNLQKNCIDENINFIFLKKVNEEYDMNFIEILYEKVIGYN